MKTSRSLILTCARNALFYWIILALNWLFKKIVRDNNVTLGNKLFLTFEIHFWWSYSMMKKSVIKWQSKTTKKQTVIYNDQILLAEDSPAYDASTLGFKIKLVGTKQFSTRLQFEPKCHDTTIIWSFLAYLRVFRYF